LRRVKLCRGRTASGKMWIGRNNFIPRQAFPCAEIKLAQSRIGHDRYGVRLGDRSGRLHSTRKIASVERVYRFLAKRLRNRRGVRATPFGER